jgi:hypothetical protein
LENHNIPSAIANHLQRPFERGMTLERPATEGRLIHVHAMTPSSRQFRELPWRAETIAISYEEDTQFMPRVNSRRELTLGVDPTLP